MSIQARPKKSLLGTHKNWRPAIERGYKLGTPQGYPDEDSPFFLGNSSSSSGTNDEPELNRVDNNEGWSSTSRGIVHGELDSTVRSIIDDLTVENRLLRARIQNFEKREKYNRGTDKDKLFEVGLYNISPNDAKELEDILSAFVRSRNVPKEHPRPRLSEANIQSSLSENPSNAVSKDFSQAALPKSHATQSGASSNKLDSGYASMSMTPGPSSTSFLNNVHSGRRGHTNPARGNKHSHLDSVPPGLLPRHQRVVTERSKKKMVVQRLEELFTGKKLLRSRNSSLNPEQKDNGLVDHGQEPIVMEGSREANIMTDGRSAAPKDAFEAASKQPEIESSTDDMDSDEKPHKQRPTRLLDLDPQRQQIPSENVDYLRHLGVSTPNLRKENSVEAGTDVSGWVYLNLLMNMAQLHIMNVTVDFVRDAVEEVSSKFQLSSDGRSLRWRGGTEPTSLSSISGSTTTRHSPAGSESAGAIADNHVRNDYQQKVADISSAQSEIASEKKKDDYTPGLMSGRAVQRERQRHAAYYSPIFPHSLNQDTSDGLPSVDEVAVGRKRTLASNPKHEPSAKKRKVSNDRYRGIVFYKRAPFFVDINGDLTNGSGTFDYPDYDSDERSVLGCTRPRGELDPGSWSLNNQYLATRKYWDRLKLRDSVLRSPGAVTPSSSGSYFDCDLDIKTGDTDATKVTPLLEFPIQMEASCLGCILPADHFLTTVTTKIEASGQHSWPEDESNYISQAGFASSPSSQSNLREYDMESQWQRIQAKMASLRSQATISSATSSNCPDNLFRSRDAKKPVSVPPFPSLSVGPSLKSKATVIRKIVNVSHRQLESSPQPPPGLYFSEPSQTTEDESGSGSSEESLEGFDQTYSRSKRSHRDQQHSLQSRERFSRSSRSAAGPRDVKRLRAASTSSSGSSGSSGVGEEEDDENESIDMLRFAREADPDGTDLVEREWERERAREIELEKAEDEVMSLVAVGSLEDSDDTTSDEEGEVSDGTRGSKLSADT